MKAVITRINRTLFELEAGILIFGAVCQLFVFFVSDQAAYSLGLWTGIVVAGLSAFHMWWSLDKGLGYGEKYAVRYITRHNVLRYAFITLVLIVTAASGAASPLSAFLGIMGLKAAAYLQPVTKKISKRIYGEEILPDLIEEPAGEQEM